MLSKKLRVVCRDCNNGWMSQLQNAAKPILLPLMAGDKRHLDRVEQEVIARWATMFFMIFEFADPPTQVSTFADRKFFKESGKPPAWWNIYCVHLAEDPGLRAPWLFSFGSEDRTGAGGLSSIVPLNKLVLQAVAVPPDLIALDIDYPGALPITKLWPIRFDEVELTFEADVPFMRTMVTSIRSRLTDHQVQSSW